jgi:hypothetical protein
VAGSRRKCLRRHCFRFFKYFLYGFIELQDKHVKYKIQYENNSAEDTFYLTPPHLVGEGVATLVDEAQQGLGLGIGLGLG